MVQDRLGQSGHHSKGATRPVLDFIHSSVRWSLHVHKGPTRPRRRCLCRRGPESTPFRTHLSNRPRSDPSFRQSPVPAIKRSTRSAELPQPRQPAQVLGTGPDAEPPVTSRRIPTARPGWFLVAVCRLQLAAVDHLPASAWLGDEARATVAGGRLRAHGLTGPVHAAP